MKKLPLILLAIVAVISMSSCTKFMKTMIHTVADQEDLSGVSPADTVNIQKKIALTDSFSCIKADGAYNIAIVQGSNALTFDGRKVYLDNAIIKVSGDTLYVSSKEERFARGIIAIKLPNAKYVETNGASDITIFDFKQAEDLNIVTAGASEMEVINSSFKNINIEISGAGDVKVKSVQMANSYIESSGAADIEMEHITADTIRLEISGAGDVELSGNCKDLICNGNGAVDLDTEKLVIGGRKH